MCVAGKNVNFYAKSPIRSLFQADLGTIMWERTSLLFEINQMLGGGEGLECNLTGRCPFFKNLHKSFRKQWRWQVNFCGPWSPPSEPICFYLGTDIT